jgi:hypothetical protein
MSATRLLILGAVRIFQPVHGYFVRRELLSWRADQWASVNPGSIYNALRTLTKDGFLEELPPEEDAGESGGGGGGGGAGAGPGAGPGAGGPRSRGRTSYRLTPDGELEFTTMLHDAFWSLNEYSPDRMYAAVGFINFLPREEVTAGLEHRIAQIEAAKIGLSFKEQSLQSHPTVPDHTSEIVRLGVARLDGELGWARELLSKVRDGAYVFAGEGDSGG